MESPEVLREPAIAVPQSRRTVEEVSDADTPRSTLPPAVAATTPHHTIATPHHTSSGAGAMEDDSDDAAPRAAGRAPPRAAAAQQQRRRRQPIKNQQRSGSATHRSTCRSTYRARAGRRRRLRGHYS